MPTTYVVVVCPICNGAGFRTEVLPTGLSRGSFLCLCCDGAGRFRPRDAASLLRRARLTIEDGFTGRGNYADATSRLAQLMLRSG